MSSGVNSTGFQQTPVALTPPEPVSVVPADRADGMVRLDPDTIEDLDRKVAEFVDTVVRSDVQSEPFADKVTAIHNLGSAEIRAAASVSNRMLERPIKAMESGFFDEKSSITQALLDLRNTVEDLDPSRQGRLLQPRKLLGFIPLGSRIRSYFRQYQHIHLNSIMTSLYRSQEELLKDNAAIEAEKANLWSSMGKLQQYIYLGRKIDAALEAQLLEIETKDPEKARVIKEEMQFSVRQKVQDLLTQLAVSIQCYLALDMVRKNNLELIKGVDRATTTTVSALRSAVMVAQALANQKLVLEQMTALNATTGNVVESTSALLKTQSAQVAQQAPSATVSLESLQVAFSNIYETLDMITSYKVEALSTMQQTVVTLSDEVQKAQSYLDRVRDTRMVEETGPTHPLEAGDDVSP